MTVISDKPIRWPLHPQPFKYEPLYRLVTRLAENYQVSYQKFCNTVLGLTLEEIEALRTAPPEKALIILSNGIGISIDDLRKRDIYSCLRLACEEFDQQVATNPEAYENFLNRDIRKL